MGGAEKNQHPAIASIAALEGTESFYTLTIENRTADINWQKNLGSLVKVCRDAIYICDEDRDIVYANQAAADVTGYTVNELCAMNASELDPSYPSRGSDEYNSYANVKNRPVFETEYLSKGGRKIPVEVSLSVDVCEGRLFIYSFLLHLAKLVAPPHAQKHHVQMQLQHG